MIQSKKQTEPVITYSASSATNTSQILSLASMSDRQGVNVEHKLDMIEHHLKQMVWIFVLDICSRPWSTAGHSGRIAITPFAD